MWQKQNVIYQSRRTQISAVVESIQNVSAVTEEVSARAIATLESCDHNQESIQKLAEIMENLRTEAEKLQQEE